jgi:VWFA-related protein
VFGANVSLVAVPVFVTDKNGKSVKGLTAEDFEVEDNGKKAPIVAFQAVDVDAPVTIESEASTASLPVAVQAESPRQFLLLLDLEFSPPAGAYRGRSAATKFIREGLAKGDLVAVATWSRSGLRVLTNFTADHENAARALEGKGTLAAPGLDPLGLAGGFGTLASSGGRSDEEAAEQNAELARIAAEEYAGRVAAFLQNVSDLVRQLTILRGRKQLVLLSGGFRESAWNSAVGRGNSAESAPNLKRMQNIFEEAGRGDVVVHAVSLYGIPGSLDLSSRTARDDSRGADGSVSLLTAIDLASGRTTLTTFTKNTGGYFIQPTNDFGRALREVDRISRQSYVIAFEAAESVDDKNKPRSLKVRVRRPGLQVSHRTSYSPEAGSLGIGGGGDRRVEAAEAIAKGLTGGSAPLHLTTLPYRTRDGQLVTHAALNIGASAFSSTTGTGPLKVEVFGYLMDEGRVLDSLAASASLDLARFGDAVRRSGLQILAAFPVSAGSADLRFYARIGGSESSGSIQQRVNVPSFTAGAPVLSAPMFNVPLAGRVAIPYQPKDRPRIEIPFRLGAEAFVPEAPLVLTPGQGREVCVFVWPARPASTPAFEVTAEISQPGQAPLALRIDGDVHVVADSDGFDRYVTRIVVPEMPSGSHELRLSFSDPASRTVTRTSAAVSVVR